jgi:hypothetical protein
VGFLWKECHGYTVYPSGETPETTPLQDKRRGYAGLGPNRKRLRVGSPVHLTPTNESSAGGSAPPLIWEHRISAEKGKKVVLEKDVPVISAQVSLRKEKSKTIKEVQEKRKEDKGKGKEEGDKRKKKDNEKKTERVPNSPK